ncbi:MAG: hypothetical protein ACM3SV_00600 [Betaproteobacteria bacterium]
MSALAIPLSAGETMKIRGRKADGLEETKVPIPIRQRNKWKIPGIRTGIHARLNWPHGLVRKRGVGGIQVSQGSRFGAMREATIACAATARHFGRSTHVWDAVVTDEATGKKIAFSVRANHSMAEGLRGIAVSPPAQRLSNHQFLRWL